MKKMIICLATILSSISLTVNAEAVITVSDVYAQAGSTAYFTLDLSGGRAGVYESLDFAFTLPDGFSLTDNFESNWEGATIKSGKTVGMMNDTYLANGDFKNLVSVEFSIDKNVAVGTYQIKLDGFDLGYNKTQHDYPAAVTFNVFVTDVLTLDENSQVAPEDAEPCEVKVLRTIKANEWSTICLPFDVENIGEVFGEDVQLAKLSNCTFTEESGVVKNINITFAEAEAIDANTPYIIKVSKDITEFSLDEAEIYKENAQVRVGKSGSRAYMYGTYAATAVPEDNVFISNNKFWYSTGKTLIKGYRCYFKFDKNLPKDATSRISISIDGVQTDIAIPELMPNDGEYYNLNGLRVETPSKGIYIKDGKKVVVK